MSSQLLPIVTAVHLRELSPAPDPVAVLEKLRDRPYPWLLDSALPASRLARFSFAGADPYLVLRASAESGRSQLECRRCVRPDLELGSSERTGDPFARVRDLLPPPPSVYRGDDAPLPPLLGGAVGYWGYELACQLELIRFHGRDDMGLADLLLLFVDRLVAVDVEQQRGWAVGLGFASGEAEAARRAGRAADDVAESVAGCPAVSSVVAAGCVDGPQRGSARVPSGLEACFDESSYAAAVGRIGLQIEAGNVYQANLTQRMEVPFEGRDPWSLYRVLRRLNPAPFGAYLELPEGAILSSSPERFLRLGPGGAVESRPIKGTRPRGATHATDRRLERELRASEKDRAENLMIVDLVRNDLGRVCETGSVAVPELRVIERYASVFQMVSTVTGRLRSDRDAIDLLRACFPPGSMTGAPKIAAMQLLDQIEPVRRGVYAGALGYLDVRGGLDLCVVIRSLIVKDARAYLHVGGGVVADSEPHAEYLESLDKARALLAALAADEFDEEHASLGLVHDSASVW
jgi:para-aminobenzoate synthetase component 1